MEQAFGPHACFDRAQCSNLKPLCSKPHIIKGQCDLTCGFCTESKNTPTEDTVQASCDNIDPRCEDYKDMCDQDNIKLLCPLTCEVDGCKTTTTSTTTTTKTTTTTTTTTTKKSTTTTEKATELPVLETRLVYEIVHTTKAPVPPKTYCMDYESTCEPLKNFCPYKQSLRRQCPKTCGVCKEVHLFLD